MRCLSCRIHIFVVEEKILEECNRIGYNSTQYGYDKQKGLPFPLFWYHSVTKSGDSGQAIKIGANGPHFPDFLTAFIVYNKVFFISNTHAEYTDYP